MALYCWGSTIHGELGVGGIEEEQINAPRLLNWSESPELISIALGTNHTLFLSSTGKVFSCGSNDYGQLGQAISSKRPQLVKALENYLIVQVSCGTHHSMAINEFGQLFTWGSNSLGQLGYSNESASFYPEPKLVKHLAMKQVIQISSGQFHSLALTNTGELYAFGSNIYGQLGLGTTSEKVMTPTLVDSLAGIPIGQIFCGGNHSFVISKSGAVFGFGKNLFGQLGVGDLVSKSYPTQLKTLRSIGVRYISCGDDYSVFLTQDGGVFTCGSGVFGQLGNGSFSPKEVLPRMVMELMGSTVSQVSCGRRHTLTFVPSRGRVYSFGVGGLGQLGTRNCANSCLPQVVVGPWVSPSGVPVIEEITESDKNQNLTIRRIFAGGDHCFVSVTEQSKNIAPEDFRVWNKQSQIWYLTVDLAKACADIKINETVDLDLLSTVEIIFKSLACINASFLQDNNRHFCCSSKNHGVDVEMAEKAFDYIRKIEHENLKQLIWESITHDLIPTLTSKPGDIETLRIYIILPLYHEFINSKNYQQLHSPFGRALLDLAKNPVSRVIKWWAEQTPEYFERLVDIYKEVVKYLMNFEIKKIRVNKQVVQEDNFVIALNMMTILYQINHIQRTEKVPYETFHIPEIIDFFEIPQDYVHWTMDMTSSNFYLCNYPFLFNAHAKTLLLETDQVLQMHTAMTSAANQNVVAQLLRRAPTANVYIMLNVTRENIVNDTIRELAMHDTTDLKKPLKVKFANEEAEDAGGVRKEFFMLLLKDILDPKYGMFKYYDETRAIWFAEDSFEGKEMYKLIGLLLGLAIYNFTIINLPFPLALYKKLLGESVDLTDLKELSPQLAQSLQSILDYEGDDLQEVFDLNFEITREYYGETKVIPLKSNGSKIPITQENKQEFVDLYIDFVFNKSVEAHFKGFQEGFLKVCGGRVMKLFKPHELMAVVIGNEEYDWHAFQQVAEYKNGYSSSDQTIQWFWEVFHELPLEDKKKFLLYLTGSDRIPLKGIKAVKIYIQPTSDERHLPVAHTCFNLLDLPKYRTKERLKYKLLQAIQQTQGFSLV